MKTSLYLLVTFTLLLFSCGQNETNSNDFADYDTEAFLEHEVTPKYEDSKDRNTSDQNNNLKGYKVMSKQFNMPVGIMPIPNNWEILHNDKEGVFLNQKMM